MPDVVKNNAPRAVGVLKVLGSSCMVYFSDNKAFKTAGVGFITANAIMASFGGKKTEEQKEKLRAEEEGKNHKGIAGHLSKVVQPHKYPIEAAATISSIGSLFWTIAGATGPNHSTGRLIAGLTSLGSDANAAFTKERIGIENSNPHPKGTLKYYYTELRNRPVLVSSSLNIICDISSITTGVKKVFFTEGGGTKDKSDLLAGLFLLTANIFQAIFVNKNDYNLEATTPKQNKELSKGIDTKEEKSLKQETAKTVKLDPKDWKMHINNAKKVKNPLSLAA